METTRAGRQSDESGRIRLNPGETWGNLEIREHVGRGRFGDVYRAWDPALDREVALKLVSDTDGRETVGGKIVEEGRKFGDIQGLETLQNQVIEGLKTFEFGLYRKLGLGDAKGPALGARAPVPAEYRTQVDEYYRSLAAPKKKN